MVSILSFLDTGKIGYISPGVTRNFVEDILGKSEDISLSKKPLILKYGSLQLSFNKNSDKTYVLNSIHLYFDEEKISFPQKLELKGWIPNKDTTFEDFMEKIESCNFELKEDQLHTFKELGQRGYKTKSGVVVIIKNGQLDSMHLSVEE